MFLSQSCNCCIGLTTVSLKQYFLYFNLASFYVEKRTAVCGNHLYFEPGLCKMLATALPSGGWNSFRLRVKHSHLFVLDAVAYVLMLLLHTGVSLSCIAMSVTQPISWNGESSQGMEEEAQSQPGEVLCHAELPLRLLSLLQVLQRVWE